MAPNFLALATTLENLGARWLLAKKVNFVPCTHCADLAREWNCHLMMAHAVQIPKYGQIRTKSRLFCMPSRCHLTFPSCC